jgi:hypothetical protein
VLGPPVRTVLSHASNGSQTPKGGGQQSMHGKGE